MRPQSMRLSRGEGDVVIHGSHILPECDIPQVSYGDCSEFETLPICPREQDVQLCSQLWFIQKVPGHQMFRWSREPHYRVAFFYGLGSIELPHDGIL